MSTLCWSQSDFLWVKKQHNKFAAIQIQRTDFNVMVKRRRAEVKVSTLSADQRRELVDPKDKELNTIVEYSVVEAASRQGISPSALMKMRWVVTFKDDGSPNVVQCFADQRLGKIPTSSPTASRRSRQIFLTLAASLGLQTHKGDVTCAFLQGDLDERHAEDNATDLRNMGGEESLNERCLWTFRDENGVIRALCLVNMLVTSC